MRGRDSPPVSSGNTLRYMTAEASKLKALKMACTQLPMNCRAYCCRRIRENIPAHLANARTSAPATRILAMPVSSCSTTPDSFDSSLTSSRWGRSCSRPATRCRNAATAMMIRPRTAIAGP